MSGHSSSLSRKDLIEIHRIVQKRFKTTAGIRDSGLVDAIVNRPDQAPYDTEIYPDIYSKAASIMEATIRWHPFTDGNKRTGLLATRIYLRMNGYMCLYPVRAVKFSVEIARKKGQDQTTTNRLIKKIAVWLKRYVARENDNHDVKRVVHNFSNEMIRLINTYKYNPKEANRIVNEWLAVDVYPEYRKDMKEVLKFITDLNIAALKRIERQKNNVL